MTRAGDDQELIRRPPRPASAVEIAVSSIVTVHSLQSEAGRRINGRRALVLGWKADLGRWECRVEGTPGRDGTTAVLPSNLSTEFMPECEAADSRLGEDETMPHPDYWEMSLWVMQQRGQAFKEIFTRAEDRKYRTARGVTYDDDPPPRRARKLVQLLDFPEAGYEPNQTILSGEAMKFNGVFAENQADLGYDLTLYHMEWLAALGALAAMCQGERMYARGCGDGEPETVLFALLEGAPRSLTAMLEFVVMTPYMGPEEDFVGDLASAFEQKNRDAPALTWCQSSSTYCKVMKAPIGMICMIITGVSEKARVAFFRALERCDKLFPLFLQRLFKIVAREVAGTPDGLALGKYARNILVRVADAVAELPIAFFVAMNEKDKTPVTKEAIARLAHEESIRSIDDLSNFLISLVDPEDVIEFFKRWDKDRGIAE